MPQAKGTLQLQKEAAAKDKERQQNGAASAGSDDSDGSSDEEGSDEEEGGAGRGGRQQGGQRAGQQPGVGQLAIPKGARDGPERSAMRLWLGDLAYGHRCLSPQMFSMAHCRCLGPEAIARACCREAPKPGGAAAAAAKEARGKGHSALILSNLLCML